MLKESIILTCVVSLALSFPQLARDGGEYVLRTLKWPKWFVLMGSGTYGGLHGINEEVVDTNGMFIFEQISDGEPYFFIKSKMWPTYYVYMTNTRKGRIESINCEPGPAGQWLITKKGDNYTFSPRLWPKWVMCMKNDWWSTMKGCTNKEAPNAIFTLSVAEADDCADCD